MPVYGGGATAAENYIDRVIVIWKPEGTELTTVGPTVYPLCAVKAGDRVLNVAVRIRTAFDGGAVFDVGDGDNADGYIPTASITEGTAGLYNSTTGALLATAQGKLYLADDNIDLSHTGNAGSTAGEALIVIHILRGRF